jgi:hypothetical protein
MVQRRGASFIFLLPFSRRFDDLRKRIEHRIKTLKRLVAAPPFFAILSIGDELEKGQSSKRAFEIRRKLV